MKKTQLSLEGKCSLLLEKQNNEVTFFCDGFTFSNVAFLLPEIKEINLTDFSLEMDEGEGGIYQCWEKKDFEHIENFSEIINILKTLPSEIDVFNLNFTSENFTLHVYDDRNIKISSNSIEIKDIIVLIKTLMSKIFMFSEEICTQIVKVLLDNNNKYILISDTGDILEIRESYDDYLNTDKNKI